MIQEPSEQPTNFNFAVFLSSLGVHASVGRRLACLKPVRFLFFTGIKTNSYGITSDQVQLQASSCGLPRDLGKPVCYYTRYIKMDEKR